MDAVIKPASHWPIIKESEGPQSVVRSDEICSDYFPLIVSIPLPDRRTKSHIANRKLPPIVGPKSDMADYCRLPPINIFPRCKLSHCLIFHPIFHPILRSVGQWDAGLRNIDFQCRMAFKLQVWLTRKKGLIRTRLRVWMTAFRVLLQYMASLYPINIGTIYVIPHCHIMQTLTNLLVVVPIMQNISCDATIAHFQVWYLSQFSKNSMLP